VRGREHPGEFGGLLDQHPDEEPLLDEHPWLASTLLGREIFFKGRGQERADGAAANGKLCPSSWTSSIEHC
jgi:hypothetical protein